MNRIERLTEMLQTNPEDCFLWHALALEHVKLGENNAARECFEKLLDMDENYVGSYYHLAALLVRQNETEKAIEVYEKGMLKAKAAGDQHSFNELRSAYEEFTF
jgi:tetratricopeptide (TPR) repeat protein